MASADTPTAVVRKDGEEMYLEFDPALLTQLGLLEGDGVEVSVEDGVVVLTPLLRSAPLD